MNSKKYPIQNYVPTKPKPRTAYDSLEDTLNQMAFNEITNNPNYHFENAYITNFDLIHHNCRGDQLQHTKKYYQTISYNRLHNEILSNEHKTSFISSAIKSERKDVFIEKKIFKEHFNREEIEKNLQKKHVFLSSMKKNAFLKRKTDDCKSLLF